MADLESIASVFLLFGFMATSDILAAPLWSPTERRSAVRKWRALTIVLVLLWVLPPVIGGWSQ